MWGRRLGVWIFHARAPPDLIGYEKETFFGTNTARTLMVMERTNNLEGFYFFFFSFPLKHPTSEKLFFFHLVRPVAKALHTPLLFFFKGRSRIYPTLPRHFESQQKAGWSLDNHLVAFFSSLLLSLLFFHVRSFRSSSIFFFFLGWWWRPGVPRAPKKKLCIAYIPRRAHLSYFFGVYLLIILVVWRELFPEQGGGER